MATAAVPAGYYSGCEQKGGQALLTALNGAVSAHTTLSYKSLTDYYPDTDAYPDGKLWDIYSTKHWPTGEKCGNYSQVGDCYNKEHSFPKSWFDDASPMYSDLMHLYPTDGKVNGQRSNYPYGECAKGITLASVGNVDAKGKLGSCTFAGYSGTVFEPDDEYKGDLARTYFYMAACYNEKISSWHSDMLAGNNFPVFKQWAINLLLKWHRQDPVSERERTRNEAVYKHQKNRNPFIDYPEMVEYIWGDKTSEKWSSSGSIPVLINQPANGTTVDMGYSRPGTKVSTRVKVLTTNAQGNVSVTATAPFSVSTGTIAAATANTGTEIEIAYQPTAVGKHSGTLTVSNGSAKSVVTLSGEAIDGFPVSDPTDITSESFVARWNYFGDDTDGKYTLDVFDEAGSLTGYPMLVDAKAGMYKVGGLLDETSYTYTMSSKNYSSRPVVVTTAALQKAIRFLFDGDLYFVTIPGVASPSAELLMDCENLTGKVTLSIAKPFELSRDNSTWSQSIDLSTDETQFYLRLNSAAPGNFEATLLAVCGDFTDDNTVVSGKAVSETSFLEDFEKLGDGERYDTYGDKTYYGTACDWRLVDAGIWDTDKPLAGSRSLRGGKTDATIIEMLADRDFGIGTVSFKAQMWSEASGPVTLVLETSTDGGENWTTHGEVIINKLATTSYSIDANVNTRARMRLRQTAGARFMIDDIAITEGSTGCNQLQADRHSWEAYGTDGMLTVAVKADRGLTFGIYTVDGRTLHYGTITTGRHSFALPAGTIVIVSADDFSRTVMTR